MARVLLNGGLWDTDKGAFVDPAEPPKKAHSEPKTEAVDNSTDKPKKPVKKAKN